MAKVNKTTSTDVQVELNMSVGNESIDQNIRPFQTA